MDKMTLNQWVVYGNTGRSSLTMWAAITGAAIKGGEDTQEPSCNFDVPGDGDDFSRCYKLYTKCDLSKADLMKVVEVFPYWKPYIDNWDKLSELYEKKQKMYEFMQTLERESYLIQGYVETSPGYWEFKRKK